MGTELIRLTLKPDYFDGFSAMVGVVTDCGFSLSLGTENRIPSPEPRALDSETVTSVSNSKGVPWGA